MLTLKDIKKDYQAGENVVHALKGINVEFRKSEFVSILGQSGGGKTTLLNIIGGLDRYTSGDLIINGKSTKEFKDRDWDAYRNYSVGFVFQNYNLIPHQTVLSNVELALTLSGVSQKERRERAIKALEEVGLKEQIYKKPNQLSGGQMQRVAIARAIVNNPEIILADEPTGALDTETSKQVMEILKEIAKNKLVIMVTHNPELAEKYSTRIIRISDGTMLDDTNPYTQEKQEINDSKETRRTSMKFFTALNLSLNNLLTKKGRTLLTSFAGSIGIIGIALILAISTGMRNYIAKVEEDTLSSYPITIEEAVIDTSSMIEKMMSMEAEEKQREEGKIYSRNVMSEMMTTLSNKMDNNNLTELKKFLEQEENEIVKNSNSIKYNYNLDLNLYKEDTKDGIVQVNPSTVMDSMGMGAMQEAQQNSPMAMIGGSSMSIMNTNVWTEMLDNKELLQSQYDMVEGKWPEKYNEVVLIVNSNYEIDDYTLYTLGLKSQEELTDRWEKAKKGEEIEEEPELSYTYEDLLNLSFKLVLNSDYYQKEKGLWIDKSEDTDYMKKKLKDCESIKVVGIIKQNKQSTAMAMDTGIGYIKELKEYVINKTNEAKIVKEQKEKKDVNVFTGLKFPKEGEKKEFNFNDLSNEQKLAISQMSSEEIAKIMQTYTENQNATYENNLKTLGAIDLEKPTSISIYPKNFESKESISKAIEDYNQKQRDDGKDENVINYTDLVGTMMKSITQIIDAISFALIGFVSISLVVSSIMIGIITYISVLERTKEIGILRAIGASKRDISRVFNAETFIIGLIAGLMGVGITMLMTIPINSIILAATEVSIHTTLKVTHMIGLVLISLILTIIAGLIPAKVASMKDPVEALRTE